MATILPLQLFDLVLLDLIFETSCLASLSRFSPKDRLWLFYPHYHVIAIYFPEDTKTGMSPLGAVAANSYILRCTV